MGLKKHHFDNKEEGLSLNDMSLEQMTQEFSQEGILDKIFPPLRRYKERVGANKEKIQDKYKKDKAIFEDFARAVLKIFDRKDNPTVNDGTHGESLLIEAFKGDTINQLLVVPLKYYNELDVTKEGLSLSEIGITIKDGILDSENDDRHIRHLAEGILSGPAPRKPLDDLDDLYDYGDEKLTSGIHYYGRGSGDGEYLVAMAAVSDQFNDHGSPRIGGSSACYVTNDVDVKMLKNLMNDVMTDGELESTKRSYYSIFSY